MIPVDRPVAIVEELCKPLSTMELKCFSTSS